MNDYKIWLGYLSVLLGFVGYIQYFKNIFEDKIRPHVFTWFLWGLVEAIIFAIQVSENAGPGAWVSGATALICFSIAIIAYKKGLGDFSRLDWLLLSSSLLSLLIWWYTQNPLGSVILLIITDAFGFVITVKKTYNHPHSETIFLFFFSSIKSIVAIFALENYNLSTWLFPAYLGISNAAFVLMMYIRRKQLA